ncbi:MAG: hypothetical protein SAMD01599839_22790 [Rectinema sp.]
MIELRDLVLQLRKGESIKSMHRSSGRHKSVIRALKALAEQNRWLESTSSVPTEAEIQAVWTTRINDQETKTHPLDALSEDFQRWLSEGTSFVVMHKLASESVPCSEATVRRYLHRRFPQLPVPVVPRQHEPGKVMDVDFGYLGLVDDETEGRLRKAWLFSGRLRYSRKTFRKIVLTQEQSIFFVCHIEAFEYFGGVPATVTPDNLKAAVIKASWDDFLVNRAYRSLAEHYGFTISPCLPATPEHKGGVESDVKYAKRNYWPLLKDHEHRVGHEVPRLKEAVRFLDEWNDTVCETRYIAKVGHMVPELFAIESEALLPLPSTRWDPLDCAMAKVGVDWRIQFQKAFYSVPYRYIGERVLVTATRQMVRIYHDTIQIAVHSRATRPWQYVVNPEHGPPEAEAYLATCSKGLVQVAYGMGMNVGLMADAILEDRAVDGIRPLRALVGLKNRYPVAAIETVCTRLLSYGVVGYTSVKNELKHEQEHACVPQPAFRFARQAAYYGEVFHG